MRGKDTTVIIVKPVNVLLVEDNPGDVRLIHEVFNEHPRLGIHVVGNVVEACEFLGHTGPSQKHPIPDLILLDLNLPGVSATVLLTERSKIPEWMAIPVVMFTSSGLPSDRERCLALGANDYITKPREWTDWTLVLETLIDVHAMKKKPGSSEKPAPDNQKPPDGYAPPDQRC